MFKISYLDLNVFIFCTAEIDGLEILKNLRTSFFPMIKYTVAVFDARNIGDESARFAETASWYPFSDRFSPGAFVLDCQVFSRDPLTYTGATIGRYEKSAWEKLPGGS